MYHTFSQFISYISCTFLDFVLGAGAIQDAPLCREDRACQVQLLVVRIEAP